MLNMIIRQFKKPAPQAMAKEEMEESHRHLLKHESAAMYHTHMAEYHRRNITQMGKHAQAKEVQ